MFENRYWNCVYYLSFLYPYIKIILILQSWVYSLHIALIRQLIKYR